MTLIKLVTRWVATPFKNGKKQLAVTSWMVLFLIVLLEVPSLVSLTGIMLHDPKIELGIYSNLETIVLTKSEQIKNWGAYFSIVLLSIMLLLWREQRRLQKLALQTEQDKSDSLLRHFFDLPFIGMAVISTETKRWLRFNDHLCTILGYTREELGDKDWVEMTHPEDLALDVVQFERVMNGEFESHTQEKRFIRKDGKVVHASLDVKCLRKPDGIVSFVVATIADITEKKQAEEQLKRSAKVFEQSAEAIMITDANCHIISVNTAFTVISGYTESEVIGQNPSMLSSGHRYLHNL
jgi:PAS domain S-box-containing protein